MRHRSTTRKLLATLASAALASALLFSMVACEEKTNSSSGSTGSDVSSGSPIDSSSPTDSSSSGSSDTDNKDTPVTPTGTSLLANLIKIGSGAVQSGRVQANGKFYTDYETLAEEQEAAKELSVEIAEEGDVLLKNANNALPLSKTENKITLFGMASVNLVPAGGGSGGGTLGNNGMTPSTVQSAMEDAGFVVNKKTLSLYEKHTTLGTTNNELPISYYTGSVTSTYKSYNDAAVVTIDRVGAENVDCATVNVDGHSDPTEHYLQLDDNEKDLIRHVKANFDKVIVLINSANIMQIPDLAAEKTADNLGVDAILWVGTTGNNAIDAVGKILNGEVNPSGHTVDLWSRDFTKDPTFSNFGHQDQNGLDAFYYDADGNKTNYSEVEYREDIYAGYRYYETVATEMNAAGKDGETWYQNSVLYPFGYGLSYTTFEWKLLSEEKAALSEYNREISVQVEVTNTGNYAGKDVVQLYYSAPYTYGGIEKSSNNLVQFEKTDLLQPGESQVLTLTFVAQEMASYDYNDANKNGFKGYELEKGDYTITANRDSHTPVLSATISIASDIKCETDYATGNAQDPVFVDEYTTVNDGLLANKLSRVNLKDAPLPAPSSLADRTLDAATIAKLDDEDTYEVWEDKTTDPWYVSSVPEDWTQEVASKRTSTTAAIQLADMAGVSINDSKWVTFMNQLTWEEICSLVTAGTGATEVSYIGKTADKSSDGPVQISGGTLFASAPITAATYNKELAYEMGRMVGNECIFKGITEWLGPACDIHRSPFSGRNFEYYSEDGVQGGLICAEVVKGATDKGILTYLKHFFGNDQESYRADFGGVSTWATEQALREIYLKGFEYGIKYGGSMGLMSSFNRFGYQVTSGSYAVLHTLLRDQLGFTGAVVCDAWTKDYAPINMMVRGGNDQLLGSGSSYAKNNLTTGEWSEEENCVLVPADADEKAAGMNTTASPTQYVNTRIAAQNILYTRANSIANNNCLSNASIEVTIMRGVKDSDALAVAGSTDVDVTITSGELPAGLSITNGAVSGTTNVEAGDYEVGVSIVADGWVKTTGTLTVHVVSAMCYNGENVTPGVTDTIKVGEAYEAVIDCPYYAYGNLIAGGWAKNQIVNWYNNAEYGNFNRDEDKSAADIITHPVEEATTKHEYKFEITEGTLPDGVTVEPIYGTVSGQNGSSTYEVVVGYRLVGTPTTAGTYTFTVKVTAPYTMNVNNWLFVFGMGEYTYTETITLVVV